MNKNKRPISVLFEDEDIHVDSFIEGETLLDLALRNNLNIPYSCGGYGTCGTCRVFIQQSSEQIPLANEIEQEFSEMRGFRPNERLACQIELTEKMKIIFSINPECE